MNYKNKLYSVVMALACTLWASNVFAFGMGVAVMKGSETWEDDLDGHNGDRDSSSFGLVLDTAIAKDSLFNYRLTIATEDNEPSDGSGLNLEGIAFTHDFGFAVYRNQYVRLWLGPELKFGFYDTVLNDGTGRDADGGAIGWGFGPVFGVNVHVPKVVTFSASLGYHFVGFYADEYDIYQNGSYQGFRDIDADYTGATYLNLSLLFRFGADNF